MTYVKGFSLSTTTTTTLVWDYVLSTITEYVEWEDDDIQILCFHLHFLHKPNLTQTYMLLYMGIHAILHLHRIGSYFKKGRQA